MPLFEKPVLGGKRRKALDKSSISRELFELMELNLANTPIFFYPRRAMRVSPYSVTQGENVSYYKIIQIGGMRRIERESFINLPAEHIFEGDKMTLGGILTLSHEYAHFPKPKLMEFAVANGISFTQAEELMADVLSAKLAVKMGFSKEQVISHFAGREIVYGSMPFRQFILRAIG
ncbi:MAG: hypothetical protein NT067_01150 [Candidatus Diapherotrites archaeon]|nr:hypothetical protein [Candidatus Diapherotrites archaeon]